MVDLQPLLHDLLVAVAAPTQAWSGRDGQVRPSGAQGCYDADVRVLSTAILRVGGREPEAIAAGRAPADRVPAGSDGLEVLALVREADDPGADPTLRLRRTRVVSPGRVAESLVLEAATAGPVEVEVELELACDLAPMDLVKRGRAAPPLPARGLGDDVVWAGVPGPQGSRGPAVTVREHGAEVDLTDPLRPVLRWRAVAAPGAPWTARWELRAAVPGVVHAAGPAPSWSVPRIECDDRRLPALLDTALRDLHQLRMVAAFAPEDVFLAAGAPWFFTLFGRDSLWAARMMLPLGTELAAGTLRALAARQGTRVDPATAEQPGKILHEIRAASLSVDDQVVLPPVYYGTVDATPLWVLLLHDAWRWGMPRAEVEALLPAMQAALAWMAEHGDADGDGFLEYLDETGTGLANQGWKDSGDSVQWRDGRLATGPIALCEVQGYAHEAAIAGAALLDAFDLPGGDGWRAWAAELATRFRAAFWVHDELGPYPAIALDADKRPVDSVTSNMGHLLGTGLLSPEEEATVAARLVHPSMSSGYGLRTLAEGSGGYWPLRYHGGTVWAHDTAIAVAGLSRAGRTREAAVLVEGLLAAGAELGYRLPELYGGDARGTAATVVPYPAACRPQAWSAASAVVLLQAVLGVVPDVPHGTVRLDPARPSPVGALRAAGLRLAGGELTIELGADGELRPVALPPGVRLA